MDSLAAQIIIDILINEMSLDSQKIWLRDENRKIPDDRDMFIIVGLMDAHPIANIAYMIDKTINNAVQQWQVNEVQQREIIQVDILSRNSDAKLRNWEIVAAMQSIYAQQQQELNNFKIFRIPENVSNTSGAEGGSNINRYSISIPCFVWYRKEKLLNSPLGDYYDDFTTRVDDVNTIGTNKPLIEFEITQGTPAPP